jgi:hypothetical protein
MGQGNEPRNKVTTGNEEVEQTNTRKEEQLAGTSTDDATTKRSQATFIFSTDGKT